MSVQEAQHPNEPTTDRNKNGSSEIEKSHQKLRSSTTINDTLDVDLGYIYLHHKNAGKMAFVH